MKNGRSDRIRTCPLPFICKHLQKLTHKETHKNQSRLVAAWSKLSAPLKAAILAIVESSAASREETR
jgi:hypothetical protein